MAKSKSRGSLGKVVVIGGNGFLGHHIVNQLVSDWTTASVSSIDLRCARNRNDAAAYYECDITDSVKLTGIMKDIAPDVVIHTASPVAIDTANSNAIFKKVNVGGTQAVIEACQKTGVKALVYTSSASVISDNRTDLHNADERWPVIRGAQQSEYYTETKAEAEELALKANRQDPYKLLTCAIRPAGIFGEGDVQALAGLINAYRTGKTRVQMGEGYNVFDFTYVGNIAHAHLLAAQLLLATAGSTTVPLDHERVDGEAFIITNDSPVYFWDFARAVWRAAGNTAGTAGNWTLSRDVGLALGWCSEMFFWAIGKKPLFTRQRVAMSCMTRYFNITKAKRVLRYQPLWTLQQGVDRGVGWFIEQEAKGIETARP